MAMRPREASSARLSARVLAARDAAIPAGVPQGAGKRRRPESRPRSAPARTARCVRRRRPDRRPDQARDLRSRPAGEDERDRPADPAARRNAALVTDPWVGQLTHTLHWSLFPLAGVGVALPTGPPPPASRVLRIAAATACGRP